MFNIFKGIIFLTAILTASSDFMVSDESLKLNLNTTVGGPYTYSQSKHHFYGVKLNFSRNLFFSVNRKT